jgi:hypothetical protein
MIKESQIQRYVNLYSYLFIYVFIGASELYRPSDRRLSAKWVPTFADRGRHVVSATDPYCCILGFLDRSRYFSIKQLLSCSHEAEWTPFQTHYFFFSGSAWNRTQPSGSVAKTRPPLDHRGGPYAHNNNNNSVALVREGTIPTDRPPLVGEFCANFLRIEGVAWSVQRIPISVLCT